MNPTNKQPTLEVRRDDEPDYSYMPAPPSPLEVVGQAIVSKIGEYTGNLALQAQMALFDVKHGTHYRTIRNELVEQQKRTAFEKKIGLVAVGKK